MFLYIKLPKLFQKLLMFFPTKYYNFIIMKSYTIGLLFAAVSARKHHHRHHKADVKAPYVPESASINADKPLYYTVPKDWEG